MSHLLPKAAQLLSKAATRRWEDLVRAFCPSAYGRDTETQRGSGLAQSTCKAVGVLGQRLPVKFWLSGNVETFSA